MKRIMIYSDLVRSEFSNKFEDNLRLLTGTEEVQIEKYSLSEPNKFLNNVEIVFLMLHDRFDKEEEENKDKKNDQKLFIFEPGIRICSKVADSQKYNHSVYDDYPYCPAAIDYTLVAQKLTAKK